MWKLFHEAVAPPHFHAAPRPHPVSYAAAATMFRLLAFLLIFSCSAIALTCPAYLNTRKGLLFLHMGLAHGLHSWLHADERVAGLAWTNLLLSTSMIAILVENLLTINANCGFAQCFR